MIIGLGILLIFWVVWILFGHWEYLKTLRLPKGHLARESYGETFKATIVYPFGLIVCFGFLLVSCISG